MTKKITLVLGMTALMILAASCNKGGDKIVVKTDEAPELTTANDTLSYALGFSLAQTIASTGLDVNREVLFEAICVTLDSKQQPMSQEQTMNAVRQLEEMMFTHQREQNSNVMAEEEKYFADLMAKNPNVKKSESGIYYEVLEEGTGMQGKQGLVAEFDFRGFFANGQIFDQTYGNRPPIVHVIGEPMMPGLIAAFCEVRGGGKYRVYLPSAMAYGSKGTDMIPPNAVLIYELEIHDIHE